jgi:hypothetical protein
MVLARSALAANVARSKHQCLLPCVPNELTRLIWTLAYRPSLPSRIALGWFRRDDGVSFDQRASVDETDALNASTRTYLGVSAVCPTEARNEYRLVRD